MSQAQFCTSTRIRQNIVCIKINRMLSATCRMSVRSGRSTNMDLCFVITKLTLKPLLATVYRHSENLVKDNQTFCPCNFFVTTISGPWYLGISFFN